MKAYRGSRGIAPIILSGDLHTPTEVSPVSNGPSLDISEISNVSCYFWEWNTASSILQPTYYTN